MFCNETCVSKYCVYFESQFKWIVVLFGLQGLSSLLMLVMNQDLTVGLYFPSGQLTTLGLPDLGVIHS